MFMITGFLISRYIIFSVSARSNDSEHAAFGCNYLFSCPREELGIRPYPQYVIKGPLLTPS